MYTVAVSRQFSARHYLIGGDWGAENQQHAHQYQVEVQLEGQELDRHGYLVDIVEIEAALEALVRRYRDQVLNEMPEFESLNPSVEHFARILCHALAGQIQAENLRAVSVKLWENEIAWASYRLKVEGEKVEN